MPRANQPATRRPGRPPAEEGDGTRQAILRAAWRQFNTHSYTALSMDDLARAAGVTKATLYYHHAGKAELFVAAVREHVTALAAQVDEIHRQPGLSTHERLVRAVAIWYGPGSDEYNAELTAEAVAHLPPAQRAEIEAALDLLNAPLLAMMEDGIAAGELRPLPPALLAYAFQVLFADIPFEALGAATAAERAELQQAVLGVFMQGVRRGGEPSTGSGHGQAPRAGHGQATEQLRAGHG